jgi:glycosyltransferase involved in cell wall biosynthesis
LPSDAGSYKVLYPLKYLSEKYGHDITLVAFRLPGKDYPDLSSYCWIEAIDIACWPGMKSPKAILYAFKNLFSSYNNMFSRRPFFLNCFYSSEMNRRIKALLDNNRFDILVVEHPSVLHYASNKRVPIVLLETFALSEIAWMEYKLEKNWLKKVIRLLYYYQMKNYAEMYRVVNVPIAVSAHQRNMVRAHCPDLNIVVIPHGIDIDYLRAVDVEDRLPTLNITGGMDRYMNVKGVLWFYNEVYRLIKARVPQVKLYIVGSNPKKEILRLASDTSVVVTGYVEDLRPYLSRAWVVVAPLQDNFGVKTRVLQAMAVGKPVVSTSMVTAGIDVSPEQDIIIADSPTEFAERVIELLNDRQLREKIGAKARLLMETNHSWEKLTDRLNEVLEETAKASY